MSTDGSTGPARLPQKTDLTGAALDTVSKMAWFKSLTFPQVITSAFVAGFFWLVWWTVSVGLPKYDEKSATQSKISGDAHVAALKAVADQNAEAVKAVADQNAEAVKTVAANHADVLKRMLEHAEKASAKRDAESARSEAFLREIFGKPKAAPAPGTTP